MRLFFSFLAGFLATLLFHQPALWMLNEVGMVDRAAYGMSPTWPFGIPAVISLAFWGGLWGIPAWLVIRRWRGALYWIAAIVFGAVLPTLVAGFIVAPIKGQPIAGGGDPAALMTGVIVNGAWGLGTALFLWLMIDRKQRARS